MSYENELQNSCRLNYIIYFGIRSIGKPDAIILSNVGHLFALPLVAVVVTAVFESTGQVSNL